MVTMKQEEGSQYMRNSEQPRSTERQPPALGGYVYIGIE